MSEKERDAFEREVHKNTALHYDLSRNGDRYTDPYMHVAYTAWQAALASQAQAWVEGKVAHPVSIIFPDSVVAGGLVFKWKPKDKKFVLNGFVSETAQPIPTEKLQNDLTLKPIDHQQMLKDLVMAREALRTINDYGYHMAAWDHDVVNEALQRLSGYGE